MYDEALKLILSLASRKPAAHLPRKLDALFKRLAATDSIVEASQIEELIWQLWMQHADGLAEEKLDRGTRAIAARDYETAEALLDELIIEQPSFAEAWNKRATLRYLQKRDDESVADLSRALELEPRHFGAICGFAQICLRHGERAAALFAFDAALRINPHLTSIRAALEQLIADGAGTLH